MVFQFLLEVSQGDANSSVQQDILNADLIAPFPKVMPILKVT